ALHDSVAIAVRARFDLVRDLGYEFPHHPVPRGETSDSHLARICYEALQRKYGSLAGSAEARRLSPLSQERKVEGARASYVEAEGRLEEELALIKKHNLAGFFLAY